MQKNIRGNSFILELQVPRVYFQDVCTPRIREKLGVSRISWIRKKEEWEKKREELLLPSLFPEREALFLEDLREEAILEIAQEAPRYGGVFFFFLISPEMSRGASSLGLPWIVVAEDREAFFRFLKEEEARLGLTLDEETRETLFQFTLECELQRGDIEDFLEEFKGERVSRSAVEAFFMRNEKVLLFRFLDALSERDTPSALQYVYRLVEQQFPPSLLVANLARRFRLFAQLYEAKEIERDLWQGKSVNPFEAKKVERMKKHFSPSDVLSALASLRAADRLLKTQSVDLKLWCALLVVGITQPGRGAD